VSQIQEKQNFVFPFAVSQSGRIRATGGDDAIRAKIIQVLFTTRGERVNQPEFGCGLFDLVFDMNDPILAASVEFTVGQALTRWLANEIRVEAVNIKAVDENLLAEIAYVKRADMATQAVRISFR
jgi:phage baseplate assembly protein W